MHYVSYMSGRWEIFIIRTWNYQGSSDISGRMTPALNKARYERELMAEGRKSKTTGVENTDTMMKEVQKENMIIFT